MPTQRPAGLLAQGADGQPIGTWQLMEQRLRIGWGSLRVALGIGLGQRLFEYVRAV